MKNRVLWFFIILIALCIGFQLIGYTQSLHKQTDPKDIRIRQAIDKQIEGWLQRINNQVQTDTLKFTTGTSVTVYLPQKYPDKNYTIFFSYRTISGTFTFQTNACVPLTDSSFSISKASADVSVVQWMVIHK